MLNFRSWAAGLIVAALAAGCGGGGGGGSTTPQVTASISPTSAVLSSTTTTLSLPSASLALSATNAPTAGLYIGVSGGKMGYVTAAFDGSSSIIVTGVTPSTLAVGTYQDSVSVQVCYDDQCARQISNSPLTIPVTYTIALGNPATATPAIVALSPTSAVAGGAGFTLAISGSNFAPTSAVLWNGQVRAATYVSPTALNVQVNASDIASITTAYVSVSNTSTGGGTSGSTQFLVTAPVPTVASLQPPTAAAGGSAYTLTVNGTAFDSSAQVTWNGSALTTVYVSPTKVTAQVTAADIAAAGTFPVAVYNLDDGSVSSNAVNVMVANAPLALTSLAPAFVSAGGPAYVQTLVGTGFNTGSTVQWNGSPRTTTFLSTTQLQAAIGTADIASIGSAGLTVVNGGASPGTSATLTLAIVKPSGDAVAYQINPQHNGAVTFANVVPASAFPLSPTWTAHLDGIPGYALVAGGRVFATVAPSTGGAAELVALSAASGAVVWGPIALSGGAYATYDNGKVIVLTSTIGSAGLLTGYDAASGAQVWSTLLTTQYSFQAAPTALNGIVYVGASGEGGTLYAVDDSSGGLLWTASVMNGDWSSPAVTGDGVYVSYPCQTYDFMPTTGALVWNNSTGCEGGGGATGTLANGVYYSPNGVAGFSGMAFDAETGVLHASYAADWPPAIGASTGYFIQGGTLHAINNATNVIQWSFAGDAALAGAPILVNNYVFVASSSGKLYAVDAASGATLWQTDMGGNVFGSSSLPTSGLSAGDGLLLVPGSGTLTAYTLSNNP